MKIKGLVLMAAGVLALGASAHAGPRVSIVVNPGVSCRPQPIFCAPRPVCYTPVAYYNTVPAYFSPVWVTSSTTRQPRIWPSAGVNRVPDPVFVTEPVVTTTTFRWKR